MTKDNLANLVEDIKSTYDTINNDIKNKLITKDNLAKSVEDIKSTYDTINNDIENKRMDKTNLANSVEDIKSKYDVINNNLNSKIQLKNTTLLDVGILSIQLTNAQNSKDYANRIVIDTQLELNVAKNKLDQTNEKINNQSQSK